MVPLVVILEDAIGEGTIKKPTKPTAVRMPEPGTAAARLYTRSAVAALNFVGGETPCLNALAITLPRSNADWLRRRGTESSDQLPKEVNQRQRRQRGTSIS